MGSTFINSILFAVYTTTFWEKNVFSDYICFQAYFIKEIFDLFFAAFGFRVTITLQIFTCRYFNMMSIFDPIIVNPSVPTDKVKKLTTSSNFSIV